MVYIYKGLFSNTMAIAGYTYKDKFVTLNDILILQYAYDKLSEILGSAPSLCITEATSEDEVPSRELIIPPGIDASKVQEIDLGSFVIEGFDANKNSELCNEIVTAIGYWQPGEFMTRPERIVGAARNYYETLLRAKAPQCDRACFMFKPTDTLQFEVPSYSLVKKVYDLSDEKDLNSTLEAADKKTSLFGEEQSDTGLDLIDSIADADDLDDAQLEDRILGMSRPGRGDLSTRISVDCIKVDTIFDYYDCRNYEDALKVTNQMHKRDLIRGKSINNSMGIQENEHIYYTALKVLTCYGICKEKDIVTYTEYLSAVAKGISSEFVNAYLKDLIREAIMLNWTHTGNVMYSVESVGEDENPMMKLPGAYKVIASHNAKTGKVEYSKVSDVLPADETQADGVFNISEKVDLFTCVCDFISRGIINSYAFTEALIRLLRWGERKPSHLSIASNAFDNNGNVEQRTSVFLNLNTAEVVAFDGDESTLNVKMVDGSQFIPDAIIYSDSGFMYASALNAQIGTALSPDSSVPCGLRLRTEYTNLDAYKYTYIDIFTLLHALEGDDIKLPGIGKSGAAEFSSSLNLGTISLTEVIEDLHKEREIKSAVVSSPTLIRERQRLEGMFKGTFDIQSSIAAKNINVFELLAGISFMSEDNFAEIARFTEIISVPQMTPAEIRAIKQMQGDSEKSLSVLIDQYLALNITTPFLYLTDNLKGEQVDIAKALTSAKAAKNNKARKKYEKDGINPKFRDGLYDCSKYVTVLDDAMVPCMHIAMKTVDGRSICHLWKPGEFTFENTNIRFMNIRVEGFNKQIIEPLKKRPALLGKLIFCATEDTLTDFI